MVNYQRKHLYFTLDNKFVPHFIEKEALDEFTKSLSEKVDNIFDEKFDAAPEFRKCSRCDYASICDAKEEVS